MHLPFKHTYSSMKYTTVLHSNMYNMQKKQIAAVILVVVTRQIHGNLEDKCQKGSFKKTGI